MKLTKETLKQIIKEELDSLVSEEYAEQDSTLNEFSGPTDPNSTGYLLLPSSKPQNTISVFYKMNGKEYNYKINVDDRSSRYAGAVKQMVQRLNDATRKRGEVRTIGQSAGRNAGKIANIIRSLLKDAGAEELPTNDIIFGMRGIVE